MDRHEWTDALTGRRLDATLDGVKPANTESEALTIAGRDRASSREILRLAAENRELKEERDGRQGSAIAERDLAAVLRKGAEAVGIRLDVVERERDDLARTLDLSEAERDRRLRFLIQNHAMREARIAALEREVEQYRRACLSYEGIKRSQGARLSEQGARLDRLDALLASEEPSAILVDAVHAYGNAERMGILRGAWRWLREQLGGGAVPFQPREVQVPFVPYRTPRQRGDLAAEEALATATSPPPAAVEGAESVMGDDALRRWSAEAGCGSVDCERHLRKAMALAYAARDEDEGILDPTAVLDHLHLALEALLVEHERRQLG